MTESKRKGRGKNWQGTSAGSRTRKAKPKSGHVAPRRITDGIKPDYARTALTQADHVITAPLPATTEEGK